MERQSHHQLHCPWKHHQTYKDWLLAVVWIAWEKGLGEISLPVQVPCTDICVIKTVGIDGTLGTGAAEPAKPKGCEGKADCTKTGKGCWHSTLELILHQIRWINLSSTAREQVRRGRHRLNRMKCHPWKRCHKRQRCRSRNWHSSGVRGWHETCNIVVPFPKGPVGGSNLPITSETSTKTSGKEAEWGGEL